MPSTQDYAKILLRQHLTQAGSDQPAADFFVVRSSVQTQGRGRRAHSWQSLAGGSYQTILFPPEFSPSLSVLRSQQVPSLTLWLALGIVQALSSFQALQPQAQALRVKWPNDLYMKDDKNDNNRSNDDKDNRGARKVAGILCEMVRGWLLVGLGMNVDNPIPSTASRLERPKHVPLEHIHTLIIHGMVHGLTLAATVPDTLPQHFAPIDLLAGASVTVENLAGAQRKTGRARGVDKAGCLLLQETHNKNILPTPICQGHVVSWS